MLTRRERHNRDWLLIQFKENPKDEITLFGYLSLNNQSNWVSFTQVENEEGLRISGHINLPERKVKEAFADFKNYNHKAFILKGHPSFYNSRGTKRGCLQIISISLKEIISQ
tara:strand:+ start:436 stop:771 length:336 start_codon:yes stop_codon:yes gene_type:complete